VDLVELQEGTLPIILSAPHGGSREIPGVPPRTKGVTVQDSRTAEVARGVADALEKLLGAKPYLVAAQFHRRFVDANRPEADALEAGAARPVYTAYHAALRRFVDEVRRANGGRGLLLDIHGQQAFPTEIHRGTRGGATVSALVKRAGEAGLTGPDSVCGALIARGYAVVPSTGVTAPPETRAFNGGHIVGTYGSHHADGIDAIQLELGRQLRLEATRRAKLIDDLAAAISAYRAKFL